MGYFSENFQSITTQLHALQSIFETTPIGLCITDENGIFEEVNAAYCRTYGYTHDELIGQHFTVVVTDANKEELSDLHDKFIAGQYELQGQWVVKNKQGEEIVILSNATRITGDDGKPRKVTFVIDITNRIKAEREAEDARQRAEVANKLKSEFLANISHEIRTPMNAIIGFAELLDEESSDPSMKEKISIIRTASARLLDIVNELLDFSKIEAGRIDIKPIEFSLRGLLEDIKHLFRLQFSEKNLSFFLKMDDNLPEFIKADEKRLRQVLINLVGNAVKFTHEGRVELNASFSEAKKQIFLEVKDTGQGIPKEKLESIFAKYEQIDSTEHPNYGGTGLGLAISKKLCELMGGDITVDSELKKGSSFRVNLPVKVIDQYEQEPEPAVPDHIDLPDRVKKLKILLAEDDQVNRYLIDVILKRFGMACDHAENGEIAIQKMKQIKYDILLLDKHMPVLNGRETIEKMNSEVKNVPSVKILFTADAFNHEEELKVHECDYILTKPISKDKLMQKLSELADSLVTF